MFIDGAMSVLFLGPAKCESGAGQHRQLEARGQDPRPGLPVTDVCCTGQNEPWHPDYGEPSVRGVQSAAYPSPETNIA